MEMIVLETRITLDLLVRFVMMLMRAVVGL